MRRLVLLSLLTTVVTAAQTGIVSGTIEGPPISDQGPTQPTGTASIEGTVVNDITGEPLKKTQVSLFGRTSGGPQGVVTDASGSFAFHKLPAGTFMVNATRDGFDQTRAMILGGSQKQVTVTADQDKSGVELRLPPMSAISGRLTDDLGDPAPHCTVAAVAAGASRGDYRRFNSAQTDDRGEYRIANLAAGRYQVYQHCRRTQAAPHGFMEQGDPRTPAWAFIPGFYGGAEGGAGASTLTVHSGQEIGGIDFRLKKTNAFTVSIILAPDDPGIDLQNVSVQLMPRDPSILQMAQYGAARMNNGGPLRVSGVVPGSYVAVADYQQGEARWHGEAPVEVGETMPDPVRLPVQAALTIHGDVAVEGEDSQGNEPSRPPPRQLSLMPVEGSRGAAFVMAQPAADRSFAFSGVIPGRYQLQVNSPDGDIQSVTLGGRDVSPQGFDIGPGAGGPLHVVVGTRRARVQVSVTDLKADRTTWVFLLPKGVEASVGLVPPMAQATQGPATVTVSPGEYVAYAVECAQPWPLVSDAGVISAIAGMGKAVEAKGDGTTSVTVGAITRDDLKRALDGALQ